MVAKMVAVASVFFVGVFATTGSMPDPLNIPTKKVATGVYMPMFGLGTGGMWAGNATVTEAGVTMALKLGVRAIDTALGYGTQAAVARGMRAAGVSPSDIFITTKVPGALGEKGTIAAHEKNLEQLGVKVVDLLLVHLPCGDLQPNVNCSKAERQATWRGLEAVHKAGKARAIGVSHYCQTQLEDVLEIATVPVSVNQEEWHVGMGPDPQGVVSFCRAHNILYQSFMPLGRDSKELITGPLVTSIGKAHNVSGPQVAMRWLIEQGSPVIPQTNKPEHLREDVDIFWSFALTQGEKEKLNAATSPASEEPVSADCKEPLVEYV